MLARAGCVCVYVSVYLRCRDPSKSRRGSPGYCRRVLARAGYVYVYVYVCPRLSLIHI